MGQTWFHLFWFHLDVRVLFFKHFNYILPFNLICTIQIRQQGETEEIMENKILWANRQFVLWNDYRRDLSALDFLTIFGHNFFFDFCQGENFFGVVLFRLKTMFVCLIYQKMAIENEKKQKSEK